MTFLLKRRDGRDIAKKRYCPVQNGTYGQPINESTYTYRSGSYKLTNKFTQMSLFTNNFS
jgi:hypothetical protein